MKKSDKVIVIILLFFLLFCLSYVATKNFVPAIIVSFLLTVTASFSFRHIVKRYEKLKKIPVAKIEDGLAFRGIKEQTRLFADSLPEESVTERGENYFAIDKGEKIAVFPCYKFSPCGKDDIAKFYNICKEKEIKICYVLSRQNPRELLLFARGLPLEFRFVKTKEVRAYLTAHNLVDGIPMPQKEVFKRKKPSKETFREILTSIFTRERAKYFAVSGVSLAIMSLFVPFRVYYAVFATLTLSFAIACYLKNLSA